MCSRMGFSYRQQALHDLTRDTQAQRANTERQLYNLPAIRLKDPVEGNRDGEEGEKVQRFVALLVGGNFVVGGREAE